MNNRWTEWPVSAAVRSHGIIPFVDPSNKIIRFHLKLKIIAAFPEDLAPKIVSRTHLSKILS